MRCVTLTGLRKHTNRVNRARIRRAEQRQQLVRIPEIDSVQESASEYRDDPVKYARDVLGMTLTPQQQSVCESVRDNRLTACPSGHVVGKTAVAAMLASWWYDTRNPSLCITSAPTYRQTVGLVWGEIRKQRARVKLGGFNVPRAPRLESSPDHLAFGQTSRDAAAFQGWHNERVLIILDEADGIEDAETWDAVISMLGGVEARLLCIYNPVQLSGPCEQYERRNDVNAITLSCLDHPNIEAQLAGREPVIPGAITLEQVELMLDQWADPVNQTDFDPDTDFEFNGVLYRSNPVVDARVLGRRPRTADDTFISPAMCDYARSLELPLRGTLAIGVDPAGTGSDRNSMTVRVGGNFPDIASLRTDDPEKVVGRSNLLADEWTRKLDRGGTREARQVPILVDVIGVGYAVYSFGVKTPYNWIPINVSHEAPNPHECFNLRAALWLGFRSALRSGEISLAMLPQRVFEELKEELCAVRYELMEKGILKAEKKEKVKERLGKSPDLADSTLLSCATHSGGTVARESFYT